MFPAWIEHEMFVQLHWRLVAERIEKKGGKTALLVKLLVQQ